MKDAIILFSLLVLFLLATTNITAQDSSLVGVLDLKSRSERLVTLTTASVSNQKVVILYRGTDPELFQNVSNAAQSAVNGGFQHLAGIVWADPSADMLGGKDCVQIYFDGVPVTALLDVSDPNTEKILEKGIVRAYEQYSKRSVNSTR